MKMFTSIRNCLRIGFLSSLFILSSCSSTSQKQVEAQPSDDILELLTGFGESISKRNFTKAVGYLSEEDQRLLLDPNGSVPEDKQRMLAALPLQRLIKHPMVRVENGRLAGIYSILPNLRQGEPQSEETAFSNEGDSLFPPDDGMAQMDGNNGETSAQDAQGEPNAEDEASGSYTTTSKYSESSEDPYLKETVSKFFAAINSQNWSGVLALINENERKLLLDDKGRIKEDSKKRLSLINKNDKEALLLQDGKLTGVTLIMPTTF